MLYTTANQSLFATVITLFMGRNAEAIQSAIDTVLEYRRIYDAVPGQTTFPEDVAARVLRENDVSRVYAVLKDTFHVGKTLVGELGFTLPSLDTVKELRGCSGISASKQNPEALIREAEKLLRKPTNERRRYVYCASAVQYAFISLLAIYGCSVQPGDLYKRIWVSLELDPIYGQILERFVQDPPEDVSPRECDLAYLLASAFVDWIKRNELWAY